MNNHKRFSRNFILLLTILVALNLFMAIILKSVFEHNSLSEIVSKQISSDSIYGSLLNNNEFEYSLSLISEIKPEVIALGSSRVLAFREEFFSKKFVGAGRAVTQIKEAEMVLSRINEMDRLPNLILFGLDFWWFQDDLARRNVSSRHIQTNKDFAISKLRAILTQWVQEKINFTVLFEKIVFKSEMQAFRKHNGFTSMGLGPLYNFSGRRKDGSYFYGNIITGDKEPLDFQFKNTLARIINGSDKFRYGSKLNEEAWADLMSFLKKADSMNIEVVLFFPPLASKVFNLINSKSSDYEYIYVLTKRLENLGVFFNFHDSSILKTNDCEFIDGFHGGGVTYARLLSYINERHFLPVSDDLNKYINLNMGNSLVRMNEIEISANFNEIDFLGIGCHK